MSGILTKEITNSEILEAKTFKLIIYNDDINSFEYVIEVISKVFNYDLVRAEQLTLNIHNKGRAIVKTDEYQKLLPYYDSVTNLNLTADIQ